MALSEFCLIASLATLKPWLRIEADDTSRDTILEDLANAITEEIESETGRVFVDRTVTERRWGDGGGQLRLHYWPVVTDTLETFAVDDEDVEAEDYHLDASKGVITLLEGGVFAVGVAIDVEYVAGYETVPARVTQLAKDMIKIRYDQWASNSSGVTSMNQGQTSLVPLPDWPFAIKNTLRALKEEQNP